MIWGLGDYDCDMRVEILGLLGAYELRVLREKKIIWENSKPNI